MSNPIVSSRTYIAQGVNLEGLAERYNLDIIPVPDAVFSTEEDLKAINERLTQMYSIEGTCKMLSGKKGTVLRAAVRMEPAVKAGLVFNDGAKRRLLAITADSPIELRRRSLLSATVGRLLLSLVPTVDVRDVDEWGSENHSTLQIWGLRFFREPEEIMNKYANSFMASAGTQGSMGRLSKALPTELLRKFAVPTPQEFDQAYEACGFAIGSSLEYEFADVGHLRTLWPITRGGEGEAVQINMTASMGFPYMSSAAKSDEVLGKVLEVVAFMETSPRWSVDAARTYTQMMGSQPGFVLFLGKTKSDIYSRDKIREGQMRFYLVMPGHLKLYVQRLLQPFCAAKLSIGDMFNAPEGRLYDLLKNMHSAQKHGLTGCGPMQLVLTLEVQLHHQGWGYLHCGDDTLIAFYRARYDGQGVFTNRDLVILGLDMSNFDLTQQQEVWGGADDRLMRGMAEIDENRAKLWREIRRGRLTLVHGAGVAYVRGTGTSGIPGQSEVNDMIAEVVCARFIKAITTNPVVERAEGGSNPPMFRLRRDQVDTTVKKLSTDFGLDIRTEFVRSYSATKGAFNPGRMAGLDLHVEREQYSLGKTLYTHDGSFLFVGYEFKFVDVDEVGALGFALDDNAWLNFVDYPVSDFLYEHIERIWHDRRNRPKLSPVRKMHLHELFLQQGFDARKFADLEHVPVVIPDVGRYVVNLTYPTKMWVRGKVEFALYDVLRLYGSLLSSGFLFLKSGVGQYSKCVLFACAEALTSALNQVTDEQYAHVYREYTSMEDAFVGELPIPASVATLRAALHPRAILHQIRCIWDPTMGWKDKRVARDPASSAPLDIGAVSVGESWADLADEEEKKLLSLVCAYGDDSMGELSTFLSEMNMSAETTKYAGNLQQLALRAVTEKNWGRPPPDVPVRNVLGHGGAASSVQASKKTQKRRQQRRKRNRHEAADEETATHLAEARARDQEVERVHDEVRRGRNRARSSSEEREYVGYGHA